MSWTLTKYVERGVASATTRPTTAAFGTVFLALFAGYLMGEVRHQASRSPLDWLIITLFVMLALERAYYLIRAVHQLQDSRLKSPC